MNKERIRQALEVMGDMWSACLAIRDAEACEHCPLTTSCLHEDVYLDVLDLLYPDKVDEFLRVAERADDGGYMSTEEWTRNRIDDEANLRRSEL